MPFWDKTDRSARLSENLVNADVFIVFNPHAQEAQGRKRNTSYEDYLGVAIVVNKRRRDEDHISPYDSFPNT